MTRAPQASSERARSGLGRSEFPDERFEPVEHSGRFEWVLFAGLLLGGLVTWILVGRRVEAPWIMGDELTYSEYAKSFADSGEFLFREQPGQFVSIYPALIAPAWLADSMETAYSLAKAINVLLMVSAVVPLYLWARRTVSPALALLPTLLVLVMPSLVYTGMLMTESAFLPAFVLAAFVVALMLERPTPLRQVAAAVVVALAALIRLQGLVLLVVVPTAVVLKAVLDLRAARRPITQSALVEELRPYFRAAVLSGAAFVAYVFVSLIRGRELASPLGAYRDVPNADYSQADVLRWTVTHFGELSLAVGLLPVSALVVLLVLGWQRAVTFPPAQRAFLAFTAAAIPWLVVNVAMFASEYSMRVEERNMFYVAPLLFMALTIWLARGLPRPRGTTAVAVLAPTALLLALPLESLFNVSLTTDTFGLVPFLRLSDLLSGGVHDVRVVLVVGALGAGVLFAALPRWFASVAIPVSILLFLGLSAYSVSGSTKTQSHAKRFAYLLEANANWIDDRLGPDGNAALLFSPGMNADPDVASQTEFWNRSVRDVYALDGAVHVFPGVPVAADPATGLLVPSPGRLLRHEYAVADTTSVTLAGRLVAENGQLALFRLDGPVRLASSSDGVAPDGWIGTDASFVQYWNSGNGRGTLLVDVSREGVDARVPATGVRVEIGRLTRDSNRRVQMGIVLDRQTATIRSGQARVLKLAAPPPPFRVRVHVERTFSPTEYGSVDTRQLGVRVAFRFRPRG